MSQPEVPIDRLNQQLKRCHFCGRPAELIEWEWDSSWDTGAAGWSVECEAHHSENLSCEIKCFGWHNDHRFLTPEAAVEAWNQRA